MRYTAILKIKTSLAELAAECLDLFGEGANPDAEQAECFFALNNTPPQQGHIRVVVAEHIATALQWMIDAGVTSDHGEVIRVEWAGQDMVEIGTDAEGYPAYERQLYQVGTRDIVDIDNRVIDTVPEYLGRIGGMA